MQGLAPDDSGYISIERVAISGDWVSRDWALALSKMVNLEEVVTGVLKFGRNAFKLYIKNWLPSVLNALSRASASCLKRLVLVLDSYSRKDAEKEEAVWREVDDTLASKLQFPDLEKVELCFLGVPDMIKEAEFVRLTPKLVEASRVVYRYYQGPYHDSGSLPENR